MNLEERTSILEAGSYTEEEVEEKVSTAKKSGKTVLEKTIKIGEVTFQLRADSEEEMAAGEADIRAFAAECDNDPMKMQQRVGSYRAQRELAEWVTKHVRGI